MEQVCLAFSGSLAAALNVSSKMLEGYILGFSREYAPTSNVFVPMMKLMAKCCEQHPQPYYMSGAAGKEKGKESNRYIHVTYLLLMSINKSHYVYVLCMFYVHIHINVHFYILNINEYDEGGLLMPFESF